MTLLLNLRAILLASSNVDDLLMRIKLLMKIIIFFFFYEVIINYLKRFLMCIRLEIRIRKGNYFFMISFYIRKNSKSIEHNINYFI
jgi:hypothetical protein